MGASSVVVQAASVGTVDRDPELLFGVLALQAGLINSDQFADACRLWSVEKTKPLADVLLKKGWITATDQHSIEYLVQRARTPPSPTPPGVDRDDAPVGSIIGGSNSPLEFAE